MFIVQNFLFWDGDLGIVVFVKDNLEKMGIDVVCIYNEFLH